MTLTLRTCSASRLLAQVTTCKGIVMGRLRSQQRQREVELMRFCFTKLGTLGRGGREHHLGFRGRRSEPGVYSSASMG
jgi:hypothetical protein